MQLHTQLTRDDSNVPYRSNKTFEDSLLRAISKITSNFSPPTINISNTSANCSSRFLESKSQSTQTNEAALIPEDTHNYDPNNTEWPPVNATTPETDTQSTQCAAHICEFCGNSFQTTSALNTHIRVSSLRRLSHLQLL